MLPDVVYGCLDQALPDTVPAEGTSSLWNLSLLAGHGLTGMEGSAVRAFNVTTFHSGGAGARPRQDGLSATPFPSGVRNVPIEITEAITPLVVWRKELRLGSGGPGRSIPRVVAAAGRPARRGGYHSPQALHSRSRAYKSSQPVID
jgi:N-methylhydantoinase B